MNVEKEVAIAIVVVFVKEKHCFTFWLPYKSLIYTHSLTTGSDKQPQSFIQQAPAVLHTTTNS